MWSIAAAYAGGGHTITAIGSFLGLHYSQVSRIVRRTENAKHKTWPYPSSST
jgi:DNA-binding MarR family transcriptional regulator